MSTDSKVVLTPNCSPSRAVSATSAACSSALVGMQPRCRQVPPSLPFSTSATRQAELGRPQGAGVAAAASTEDDDVVGRSRRQPTSRTLPCASERSVPTPPTGPAGSRAVPPAGAVASQSILSLIAARRRKQVRPLRAARRPRRAREASTHVHRLPASSRVRTWVGCTACADGCAHGEAAPPTGPQMAIDRRAGRAHLRLVRRVPPRRRGLRRAADQRHRDDHRPHRATTASGPVARSRRARPRASSPAARRPRLRRPPDRLPHRMREWNSRQRRRLSRPREAAYPLVTRGRTRASGVPHDRRRCHDRAGQATQASRRRGHESAPKQDGGSGQGPSEEMKAKFREALDKKQPHGGRGRLRRRRARPRSTARTAPSEGPADVPPQERRLTRRPTTRDPPHDGPGPPSDRTGPAVAVGAPAGLSRRRSRRARPACATPKPVPPLGV